MLFGFEHPNVWERLRETKKHIVLYGMGNGCDKVLDNCGRLGLPVAGVMASDSFARYQDYRGFTVKKESDCDRELGEYIVLFARKIDYIFVDGRLVSVEESNILIDTALITHCCPAVLLGLFCA